MHTFETILYEEADGIAWITLNRPARRNAFTYPMCLELQEVWTALRHHDDVRVAVLTGAGDDAFCTGIDRSEVRPDWADDHPAESAADTAAAEKLMIATPFMYDDPGRYLGPKANDLWKPVIAAVNGMACAGAFYMLGEVDFIIAAEHATFFDPHLDYGMPITYEGVHMLQKMPLGEILRLSLIGGSERMSARRACEIGMVTEVVPAAELRAAAAWAAARIAAHDTLPVQATVRAIWNGREMHRSQAIANCGPFSWLGTNADNLTRGQQRFTAGQRPPYRVR
jgi:enoyl-CoA hydratase/carnithine racemase